MMSGKKARREAKYNRDEEARLAEEQRRSRLSTWEVIEEINDFGALREFLHAHFD